MALLKALNYLKRHTPTKIKNLKLADPGSMVQVIEPPVANQRFSSWYNIEILKEDMVSAPDLNITYNSDAMDYLVKIWDTPVISVETRWGVHSL
jgi:hypothetical protein